MNGPVGPGGNPSRGEDQHGEPSRDLSQHGVPSRGNPPRGKPLIEAEGIAVSFSGRSVLSDASATVHAGEIVTLIGPNGAGKSTLVRVMLGLQKSQSGTVRRADGLRIGYMPQKISIDAALPMTVGRFLSLGIRHVGTGHRRRAALAEVGAEIIFETPLSEISGGEMQRVLLARALLREPDLLVLDEPVQGVDITGQSELYDLIGRIRDQRGCGVLMVSHDLHLVMAATDQVVCLNHHVCCAGNPESVTRHPAYVELFGEQVARTLAVYQHHHDHEHDADGNVIATDHDPDPDHPNGQDPENNGPRADTDHATNHDHNHNHPNGQDPENNAHG